MKADVLVCLLAVCVSSPALATDARLSPITRVVELLKGLGKQIETDHEKEEDLYETFVCWGKTVIDTKTATNAAAESRIEELENYIADIEAGRVEFTSERVDLEKEIKNLSDGIEEATRMRKKANEDFLEAEDEMVKAVAALGKAITVLGEATAGHETGVFLSVGIEQRQTLGLGEGFGERTADAAALEHATQLGEKFLSKGDSLFLRRLLTGEVPKVDFKKLNRKANFKKSYKARSFKIQDVLKKLEGTFTDNLAEARKTEADAKSTFDALMTAQNDQLNKAQEARQNMESENGERGMTKEQSQDEVDALKEQVANDKKFIEQVQGELADKKAEWKDRQELRSGELAAVNKAIKILYSDDSRDLFKKSLASQKFMFLQVAMQTRTQGVAVAMIRRAAGLAGDKRLLAIASMASASSGHFDEVITAIDKMIETLKGEEAADLEIKENCEHERMSDTKYAIDASRHIDEMTDHITKLQEEIAENNMQIEANDAQVKQLTEDLKKATRQRADEQAEWAQSDEDDKQAAALVQNARDVLANFYTESGLMLTQRAKAVPVEAGKAPPPPPTTWEAPYGGKTEESTGIVFCLEMVKEDIVSDGAHAKKAEDDAKGRFVAFEDLTTEQINSLNTASDALRTAVGEKAEEVEDTKEERGSAKDSLDAVLKKIHDAEPGCDYATINYGVRFSNRNIEIDGLDKAKAILNGAVFGVAPDPNRAIKPGDALLLQRARRVSL